MESSSSELQIALLRLAAVALSMFPLGLLGVARSLTPDSDGLGTHQQLGLPPCSMRVLVGIRCPGCGMTTSWAHFTRGQWRSSLRSNVGGFFLACFSIGVAPVLIRAAWTAVPPRRSTQNVLATILLTIAAVSLMEWAWRLL